MDKYTKLVEAAHLKKDIPQFNVGDTVDVLVKIIEEGKARAQTFEGVVIARKGSGLGETFTVRKISYGEGVERVFPMHTPSIEKIVVIKRGDVKRAKLYYLKTKVGKDTKVEEKVERVEKGGTTPPREEAK